MAQAIGLIFHGIGRPGRDMEQGEARYWLDTARFDEILDRIAASGQRDRIRISFDDGNASDAEIALPRLMARGLTADFFVLSGRIGQPGSLRADQVRALLAAGMRVGSHGTTHRDWRRLQATDLSHELAASRQALQAITGQAITAAGIPFGSYDGAVLRAIRAAGYLCAYSSDRGMMDEERFLRPRTSFRADMTEAELAAVLAGRLDPLTRLRRAVGMARRRF
jgi:peptidoglycan/xylan/chitin deacetylase (PgdA/CDA1 family)